MFDKTNKKTAKIRLTTRIIVFFEMHYFYLKHFESNEIILKFLPAHELFNVLIFVETLFKTINRNIIFWYLKYGFFLNNHRIWSAEQIS